MDAFTNFAVSFVATAPAPPDTGTTVTVTAGHGVRFPAPPFNLTIWPRGTLPEPPTAEIVRCTAIAGDVLTIVRQQEATVARAVRPGDRIAEAITEKTLLDLAAGGSAGAPHHATHEPGGADALVDAAWTTQQNTFTQSQLVQTATPGLIFVDTSAPANARQFDVFVSAQKLRVRALTDASGIQTAPLVLDRSGNAYIAGNLFENDRATPLGHWQTVPFSAGHFIGGPGLVWTVAAGQVLTNHYTVIGKTLHWAVAIEGSPTSGSSAVLYCLLPPGMAAAIAPDGMAPTARLVDAGGATAGWCRTVNSSTLQIDKLGGETFSGPLSVWFSVTLEIA